MWDDPALARLAHLNDKLLSRPRMTTPKAAEKCSVWSHAKKLWRAVIKACKTPPTSIYEEPTTVDTGLLQRFKDDHGL